MIVEPARAKLNLALHVRCRRADGYHELETLFAFVAHGDTVALLPEETGGFRIDGPFAEGLASEGDNLVTRAATAFCDAFGLDARPGLLLTKNLPIASGIGGGSADAAAALRALARWQGIDPLDPRLFAIAETLGSDVPACLLGRTAIGGGRGEKLEPIEGAAGMPALLVNPRVAVSTRDVFGGWDGIDSGAMPTDGDLIARALRGRNDLEPPALAVAPVIAEVIQHLQSARDVVLARMSGSGATCFALFATDAARSAAAAVVRERRPHWWCLETGLA